MKNLWFIGEDGELSINATGNAYFESVEAFIESYKNSDQLTVQTSGSTGKPKQILLSKKQVQASVRQTAKAFNLTNEDIAICTLPIDYIAGKLMITRAMELGMQAVIFQPSSSPLEKISANTREFFLHKKGKLFFAFVPLQMQTILQNTLCVELLNSGKAILLGGTGVPKALETEIQRIQAPIFATYGMTETVTHVAIQRLNGHLKSVDFTFLPEIEFGVDETTCLKIKGEVTNNEWVQTNDVVEFTATDSFRLIGRKDTIINSGGVKIQPEAVERQIQAIFDSLEVTADFFCYGQSDTKLGQRLVLFIEGAKVFSAEYLHALFSKKLTRFEVPRRIYFVEKFQRTSGGKTNRNKTAESQFQNA